MSDYKLIDVTRLTKFKEKLLGILTYSSPTTSTSSTSIEFIDTVSQSNGVISASKKKVSTFASNTAGLVPAPGTNASGKFLGSDGKWSKPTGTTYSNYTYSTSTKVGAAGLVPQPGTGDTGKFLKGGSGWSDLPTASTTKSGIVSLSSSTNSDAENAAATPKAIKAVYAAASTAGATAGANAASSYATAAKNSADSASTYATNAKNSADSAADAASTAVTNKIKNLKYDDPSASTATATSTTFISSISQTNGVISATKKKLPTASTTNSGIVSLTDSTGSTSTTTAATPNSVTQAIKKLSYNDPDASTETSTTFISNISQTNGVISATKKKLPTVTYSAGQGIEIKNGVISVIPTMIGNPTCPDYTLYGDYFLSDIMTPSINWNDACKMKESVIVTQKYNYGANQTKVVYAKLLSKKDLETLTNNQRKINISGLAYDYYWTNTNYGASTNNAWAVYSRNGDILENSTNSNSTCCARLGFKNPFI